MPHKSDGVTSGKITPVTYYRYSINSSLL